MTNAEKFQEIFGYDAIKVWDKPENEFLEWLNNEYNKCIYCIYNKNYERCTEVECILDETN